MSLGDTLFTLVTFLILVIAVGKVAWKPVTKMMADRQQKISGDLDYAEKSRKEAETLAAKRREELQHSQADAVKIVNQAKENGEKQRQSLVDAANTEVATLKKNAQADIDQARKDALASAKNYVADLSLTIAQKLIGKELNAADQKDLIDDYIKRLGDANGSH
ncbi:F0F1 ATP synthase subunit B [Lacticaseibacillus casei]|uniref:F0F1 ATP synthase subunit B n=1 Tax=Lacticaseibacillus casei TaxID=1582 RepID=UPI001C38FBEF|nr:F0F1 ATP synthase subunit B [Lacticaseibacillus casei]QXG59827.1 F0F1 ATP synthase subunit B [Lacticaseibacillus casei]